MDDKAKLKYMVEPQKQAPIIFDADVAIAGAGITGLFAAIASGRNGARTVLIDRFGSLGGNIGPAMITGGGLYNEADYTLPGGLSGIPKEFIERLEAMLGDGKRNNASISNAVSYLALKMVKEAKVNLVLSAYAADPIVQGKVCGVFVETKSGRVAVKAKVTVDATGDASLAARAGAPIIRHTEAKPSFAPIIRPPHLDPKFAYLNDTSLFFFIADVDLKNYNEFSSRGLILSDDEQRWAKEHGVSGFPKPWIPALRVAGESGEFEAVREIAPNVLIRTRAGISDYGSGIGAGHITVRGEFDTDDWSDITMLESELRAHVFELVRFLKKHIPGFEKAYLLFTTPFLGARGGPCIEGEHTLTPEESIRGERFDDVIYVNIHEAEHGGAKEGFDVPYGILLPKGLDGLLVTGRGAAYLRRGHDPSGMRARPSMMTLGQATGVAAALAAENDVTPKTLDIKILQKALVSQGLYLGDEARLKELRVICVLSHIV